MGKGVSKARKNQSDVAGDEPHHIKLSYAGLTRVSIVFEERWIAGSRPAMTRRTHFRGSPARPTLS